ncbi:MAG TPA: Ig-like domain-containing protein [Prolixibacteraceae bacterium]|nr:Ig-like domain-containing protein [Prolixibacteraceae bacterium]
MNKTLMAYFRLNIYPLFILMALALWLIFPVSCANQGAGPTGGPRDSIPPVITGSIPAPFEKNVRERSIEITFDEYIAGDNLSEKLVVSPPLAEKPTITVRNKSVIVKLEEDLTPQRTYSFDFKDGIKDYNEGNKYENLRLVFSTYDQIDTLQVEGYVVDAQTLAPQSGILVSLYLQNSDTAFKTTLPDFIAKTDENGYYLFNNLLPGDYGLYALRDDDHNLRFSRQTEAVAFCDSLIRPEAEFIHQIDTLFSGSDTLISQGYTRFLPGEVNLRLFTEDPFNQFLKSHVRIEDDYCLLVFNEMLNDSFTIRTPSIDSLSTPISVEFNPGRDSVFVWITDSLRATSDTISLCVSYTINDSLGLFFPVTDTLKFRRPKKAEQGKNEQSASATTFVLKHNLTTKGFDLNKALILETPSPVLPVDPSCIKLEKALTDSTFEPVLFTLRFDSASDRKIILDFTPESQTSYQLSIDSGLVKTTAGRVNEALSEKFTTQSVDYYGSLILKINGTEGHSIIQLLKDSKKEELVLERYSTDLSKERTFLFLKPGNYLIRLMSDLNRNGRWDTGNMKEKKQPEPVYYFEKLIQIKSNWEMKENWDLVPGKVLPKKADPSKNQDNTSNKP